MRLPNLWVCKSTQEIPLKTGHTFHGLCALVGTLIQNLAFKNVRWLLLLVLGTVVKDKDELMVSNPTLSAL